MPAEVRQAARSPDNVFGSYVVVGLLGHGGGGEVHRAWDLRVGRFVALKFLVDSHSDRIERFSREAKMVARLSHPNIIPLYEFSSVRSRPFMTMRLVEGQTLADVRLPPRRCLEVMADVAEAVQYAHEHGVIHRDIKPSNLMLDNDGHPWVLDFGVARATEGGSTLTTAGSILGTLEYMPPEQAKAGRCDERSDVYSLGATLYHMLAGRPPFSGDTPFEIIYRLMRFDPPPLRQITSGVQSEVEHIVGKAMGKEPRHRYSSARALADDLRRHLAGQPISAGPIGPLTRVLKWTRRHRTLAWVSLLSMCLVLSLSVGSVFYALNVTRARNLTELRLAQALVAEGDAWVASERWSDARDRYAEASEIFARQHADDTSAVLGALDAGRSAGPPVWRTKGHNQRVRGIEVLPGQDLFVSCSDNGELIAFDLRTGAPLQVLAAVGPKRYFVQANPARTELVSGNAAGVLERWRFDGKAFGPAEVLLVVPEPLRGAAFSPDGKRLALGDEKGTLRLYDYASRKELWHTVELRGTLRALTISPDGQFIIGGGADETVRVWSSLDGKEISRMRNFQNTFSLSTEFVGQPPRLVTSGYSGSFAELSYPQLAILNTFLGHTHAVPRVHVDPGSGLYLTASFDGSVRQWKGSGKADRTLAVEHGLLTATALDLSGRLLIAGDTKGELYLFRVGDEASLWFWGHVTEGTFAAHFSQDARQILTQGPGADLAWWDRSTGAELYRTTTDESPDALTLPMGQMRARTINGAGVVSVWDLPQGKRLFAVRVTQGWARATAHTPDERFIVVGDLSGTLRLLDANTGEAIWTLGQAGVNSVWSADVSRDGQRLVLSGDHGQVAMWQLQQRRLLWKARLQGVDRILGSTSFADDGRTVAVGGSDRVVSVVDTFKGIELQRMEGHTGEVVTVTSGRNGRVMSASGDGSVRLWDGRRGQSLHAFQIATADSLEPHVSFSPSATDIVVVAAKNFLHTADLLESKEAWAHPPMQRQAGVAEATRLMALSRWYARRHLWDWAWDTLLAAEREGAVVSSEERLQVAWRSGSWQAAAAALQNRSIESDADPLRIKGLRSALDRVRNRAATVVPERGLPADTR
ncbi:MAG: WD40 repeat domain-containing serine/threonine-protein kinase [Deltaproteobacteria bacterium]|nr:WD40 repeat domain-containing serine/threonine-protein kinase [Deltaproteobacteria bacterium]